MQQHRKINLCFVAVIGVLLAMAALNRPRGDGDLEGVWKLESIQTNGQPPYREREIWVFRHGMLTRAGDGHVFNSKIWVDSAASPKSLDTDSLFAMGIYEIDGDTLRVAQTLRGMPRPAEFRTTRGDQRTVSVLNRLDADADSSEAELRALLISEYGPATEYPEPMEFDEEAEVFVDSLIKDNDKKQGALTAEEQLVERISWLMTEVDNGGFHQFFYNGSGNHAAETAEALRKIGAVETAALLEAGCKLFPGGAPPRDQAARQAQMESFTLDQFESLRDLEQRFYARREDLNLLLKQYWERRR
jgi:uncharacterized protein (TIGR03067 family)